MDETYESLLNDYLLSPSMLSNKDNRKQSISIDLHSSIGAISNHITGLSKPTTIKPTTLISMEAISKSKTTMVGASSKSPNYAIGGASGSNATPWNEPALSQQTKRKFTTGYSSTSQRPKHQWTNKYYKSCISFLQWKITPSLISILFEYKQYLQLSRS